MPAGYHMLPYTTPALLRSVVVSLEAAILHRQVVPVVCTWLPFLNHYLTTSL